AGSRLADEASPGRLWLQAREARIRDGMLLDSSTLTGIHSLVKHGQLPPFPLSLGRSHHSDPLREGKVLQTVAGDGAI
ncbi:MAG: hypothetical protein OXI92_09195, partial [Acidobacteriota bacterium]|nr:hypothetical protein [Acidobacteriota bacterium]